MNKFTVIPKPLLLTSLSWLIIPTDKSLSSTTNIRVGSSFLYASWLDKTHWGLFFEAKSEYQYHTVTLVVKRAIMWERRGLRSSSVRG
jgi:hypothetical protein